MKYSIKNTSAFCCIAAIMLLIIGFNGIMVHSYSTSIQQIEGTQIVKFENAVNYLKKNNKVCIVGEIFSDDAFFMPDDKTKKVIAGSLQLILKWNDGSENVLINYQKQSQYTKFLTGNNKEIPINQDKIITLQDTAQITENLKIIHQGNSFKINYCNYRFNINAPSAKGIPEVKIIRKTAENFQKSVLILSKAELRNKNNYSFDYQEVIPYKEATEKELENSRSKKIYIVIMILGFLLFFVPEKTIVN